MSAPARHPVRLDNSGLLMFLHDPTNTATLNDAPPSVLSHFKGPGDATNPALLALPPGTLVAYELTQDDPIDVEVFAGPPLTANPVGRRSASGAGTWRHSTTAMPTC